MPAVRSFPVSPILDVASAAVRAGIGERCSPSSRRLNRNGGGSGTELKQPPLRYRLCNPCLSICFLVSTASARQAITKQCARACVWDGQTFPHRKQAVGIRGRPAPFRGPPGPPVWRRFGDILMSWASCQVNVWRGLISCLRAACLGRTARDAPARPTVWTGIQLQCPRLPRPMPPSSSPAASSPFGGSATRP